MKNIYDTVIIGGGPAGISAGIYVGRKQMKSLLITEEFGGQSVVSDGIENWIGEINISGFDLAQKLEKHLRTQESIEIKQGEKVVKVEKMGDNFKLKTNKGEEIETKTIIVASGGRHRKLGVPGEDKFEGKGVSYCSTCDAPFFKDKTVAVVGVGNSGLEAVIDLNPYASKIFLLGLSDKLAGDAVTQEQVKKNKKTEIIFNAQTTEVIGDKFVTGFRYKDVKTGLEKELSLSGVFVEIGSVPNSEFLKGLAKLDKYNEIEVDHRTMATSVSGIFAAGDVTNEIYKQNNIAAGNAVIAALSVYNYILKIDKKSKSADQS